MQVLLALVISQAFVARLLRALCEAHVRVEQDFHGTLQLLDSDHVRERDKALHGGVLVGGVWNGFLWCKVRCQPVPCRFCGVADGDGHFFCGDCTFPPLVEIREHPEFNDLVVMDKSY